MPTDPASGGRPLDMRSGRRSSAADRTIGSKLDIGSARSTRSSASRRRILTAFAMQPLVGFIPIASAASASLGGDAKHPWYGTYNMTWFEVFARRKPGVSVAAANADLTARVSAQLPERRSTENPKTTPFAIAKPHAFAGPVLRDRGPESKATRAQGGDVAGRRGGDRAAHRVRQRRESLARARAQAPAGDRRAHRARREPGASCSRSC